MKKNKILPIIICLGISFFVLLLNSKCSFLYKFNGYDDVNSFYTMGKGWYHGLIPYRDLFDQKGPVLYLIYMLGYIITPNKLTGIFLLEVLNLTIILLISLKITDFFIKKDTSKYFIVALYATIFTTSSSFITGGSCEEFNLLYVTMSIYYIIKYFKNDNLANITYKDLIINGLICGLSLMIKYTTIGLWFIFMIMVLIDLMKQKRYKEILLKGLTFVTFMIIPFAIFCLYFGLNNSLNEFIDVYFYINIFKYSTNLGIIQNISQTLGNAFIVFFRVIPAIIILNLIIIKKTDDAIKGKDFIKLNKFRIRIIILTFISLFFLCLSQIRREYTISVIFYYVLILIIDLYKTYNETNIIKLITIIGIIALLTINIDYRDLIISKQDVVQYRFAEIINKYQSPTLLQYRTIDEGFYTAANVLPTTKYFETINLDYSQYPIMWDTQTEIVKNAQVMFVIVRNYDLEDYKNKINIDYEQNLNNRFKNDMYLEQNYEIIDKYKPGNGYYDKCIYYLYKRKGD